MYRRFFLPAILILAVCAIVYAAAGPITGKVSSIDLSAGTFKVGDTTIYTTDKSTVLCCGAPSTLAQLKVGDTVKVFGKTTDKGLEASRICSSACKCTDCTAQCGAKCGSRCGDKPCASQCGSQGCSQRDSKECSQVCPQQKAGCGGCGMAAKAGCGMGSGSSRGMGPGSACGMASGACGMRSGGCGMASAGCGMASGVGCGR